MKLFVHHCFLFILIMFFSLPSAFSKDLTIDIDKDTYTLAPFTTIQLFYHFFGIYSYPIELTGGNRLFLFPDFRFIATSWCDVCEEKKIAEGTFTFENGKIALKYSYKKQNSKDLPFPTSLNVFEGRIQKDNYITGFISVLLTEEGVRKIEKKEFYLNYLLRDTEFYDWQSIYSRFKKAKD